ncbi:hypothetical protein PLANPX_3438 [Lacipirellula parvula]|uniref:Uncharacterized protein n=1 Tax=Lacipirellula parvula TaxID=2650471 RepID=A0A5K7XHR8_9BACT|nr:hypothetical protein PLANPX_3438 [Lacipirellula parvula]
MWRSSESVTSVLNKIGGGKRAASFVYREVATIRRRMQERWGQ